MLTKAFLNFFLVRLKWQNARLVLNVGDRGDDVQTKEGKQNASEAGNNF